MSKKKIVVTGASRGIGYALVTQLVNDGHTVLALSRNINSLQKITTKNLHKLSVDIGNETDLNKVKEFIANNWQQVDCIIHNAGKLINKPFSETTTNDFLEVYKVNVFAVAELTRLLIPYLRKGSHVVTVSSMGGI